MSNKIIIIGGGISGITTALTLQLFGLETEVLAEQLVDGTAPGDPRFASLYPAASIIPHSVFSQQSEQLFVHSQQIFRFLYNQGIESIAGHRHFELYEFPKENPAYAPSLQHFQRIEDLKAPGFQIPARKKVDALHGWVFRCLVAEWPDYIQTLYRWYEKLGGKLKKKKVKKNEIPELKCDVIINCAGIRSSRLFNDQQPLQVVKGHLLYIEDAPLFTDRQKIIPSYNYTPTSNIYADPQGNATDVYCYPRSVGMALGGSRQMGIVDDEGNFIGEENDDTIDINGVAIPKQMYELNKEILLETYGIDISNYYSLRAAEGYRYTRSEDGDGLRLDSSEEHGKKIIHNYGHGGAGVTLSWGCALQVLDIISSETGVGISKGIKQFGNSLWNSLQVELQKVY